MIGRQTVNFDFGWVSRNFLRKIVSTASRAARQRARLATESAGAIEETTLFIADTRPALAFGIPHSLACLLLIGFGESIVFLGPLWAFWVVVPYFAARALVRKDYNAPRVVLLWMQTKAMSLDANIWHGASPESFPQRYGKYPRGIW